MPLARAGGGGSDHRTATDGTHRSVEAPLLAGYALFRRRAQPSDSLPALNPAASQLDVQLGSDYPAYVRQLAALPGGARYS